MVIVLPVGTSTMISGSLKSYRAATSSTFTSEKVCKTMTCLTPCTCTCIWITHLWQFSCVTVFLLQENRQGSFHRYTWYTHDTSLWVETYVLYNVHA
jgi:hypothetical protein